ncbi:hypothetical protein NQ314_004744 [Rhamnusium bicolor]|uniref:Uncharacterized protein n=1 Tax=Rhamnusium bicolor TaxID=1586634 RepID=A0AAV8ZLF6_9CUCU|nr:hypothetical protein NQ314_004744 [Rhamnusium bicolor]
MNSSINMLDAELENDTWLMYSDSDLLFLSSQYDDDIELNQTNLSMYPTNDFLTSLISDCCENDNFDLEFDLTSTNVFET